MEDDDEFGDLYTDVLTSFPSQPPPQATPPSSLPVDIDLPSGVVDAPRPSPDSNFAGSRLENPDSSSLLSNSKPEEASISKIWESDSAAAQARPIRVLHSADLNIAVGQQEDEKDADRLDFVGASAEKDVDFDEKEEDFSPAEQINGSMEDLGSEPVIPGLATHPPSLQPSDTGQVHPANLGAGARSCDDIGGERDDWDSDSDDDLQIVLNDNNHGPLGAEANGLMAASNDDDDDEDEEGLIIVADNDAAHQPAEEQDWGEDQGQSADGKEVADSSKANGGLTTAPKTAYSNYGYHPFHSQFKYVRPGAAPLPGGPPVGSGGALGQVRPPVNMGNTVGRGRGEWRPPGVKGPTMQKGFHPAYWGGNVQGRGLEFTLPSHKTVFDVDIDSFEEKPWKYPGVDVSDYFNFGLNEDSWKDYCKQLEQLRLESTMQSKIRVYESGRAEQEYDPDLPPELAAAAGIHDTSAENAALSKVQGEIGDVAKVSARVRPPLPTGRAIQVETGCGERLPSVDTRPPRIRDSDAVIEDSVDEGCAGNGEADYPPSESPREGDRVDLVDEDVAKDGDEYFEGYSMGYRHMNEDVARERSPAMNSLHGAMHCEERNKSMPHGTSSDCPDSGGHASAKDAGSPNERWTKGKLYDGSPRASSGDSVLDRRSNDHHQEDSIDSTEGKHSLESSLDPAEGTEIPSLEGRNVQENDVPADSKASKSKEVDAVTSDNTSKDMPRLCSLKQQKLNSRADPLEVEEFDDTSDLKAPRSSDNTKPMGISRDHLKWHEGTEDDVVKDGRSTHAEDLKRSRSEGGHDSRRKDHDGRAKLERNYAPTKGREEHHSHKDWDSYAANHFHMKGEANDWRKEREFSEFNWPRRDEELHGKRIRAEDVRKQERADVMPSRDRVKAREFDRSDKENSRKLSDDSSWRVYHEKDLGLRYRDKDDSSKSRHDVLDDHHIKKRKEDEHVRRDHLEKEERMLGRGESRSTRRKRDRDDISNQGKKDDQLRTRENMDDHARLKDEVWMQREKGDQRERDDWYRTKNAYDEHLPKREREDGRGPNRCDRNIDEKKWAGHSHGREEYNGHDKDAGRHGEQFNRRDRVEDEIGVHYWGDEDLHARGKQFGNEVKRSRQEKSSARNDRGAHVSVSQRLNEKHKDTAKSSRESSGHGTAGPSKRHRGEKGVVNEMADLKGTNEKTEAKHDTSVNNLARERRDVSSDDEQTGSKRGRSKLERWTSHKERDHDMNSKSLSSLKSKGTNRDRPAGSTSGSTTGAENGSAKKVEVVDTNQSSVGGKDGAGSDADVKRSKDGHLDTFEKLKRRSERFKVPLPSEKDAVTVKKMENEAAPSSQHDAPENSSVKPERPARKRRWISS